MIITLGFDNISLKKLYVSVATFPKPVTKFVSRIELELELLIIYYINQIIFLLIYLQLIYLQLIYFTIGLFL